MTHLESILAMPCAICRALGLPQQGRTYAHHIREGQGMAQRADDELAVPLCHEHHQGRTGIHGDRSAWRLANLDELAVLAITIRRLMGKPEPRKRYSTATAKPSKCLPRRTA